MAGKEFRVVLGENQIGNNFCPMYVYTFPHSF
jgi:hypothetical protein